MSDAVERRSRIDSEAVKGLLLINGGMSAGLLAMLPKIVENASVHAFARPMIGGIICGALGLIFAVIHTRLRRKCSLEYSRAASRQGPYQFWFLKKCQTVPNEPRICTNSIICFWLSLLCFCIGATIVALGAWQLADR